MTGLQRVFGEGLKTRANDLSVDFKAAAIKGKYLQDNYHDVFYAKARNLAWKLRGAFDEALAKVDVLIMPTTPKKARPLPPVNISLKGNAQKPIVDLVMRLFIRRSPLINAPCLIDAPLQQSPQPSKRPTMPTWLVPMTMKTSISNYERHLRRLD